MAEFHRNTEKNLIIKRPVLRSMLAVAMSTFSCTSLNAAFLYINLTDVNIPQYTNTAQSLSWAKLCDSIQSCSGDTTFSDVDYFFSSDCSYPCSNDDPTGKFTLEPSPYEGVTLDTTTHEFDTVVDYGICLKVTYHWENTSGQSGNDASTGCVTVHVDPVVCEENEVPDHQGGCECDSNAYGDASTSCTACPDDSVVNGTNDGCVCADNTWGTPGSCFSGSFMPSLLHLLLN